MKPEDPKPTITAEEFERAYAESSGMTMEELRRWKTVRPCDCGDDGCKGWQSMYLEEAAIEDAASALGISKIEYEMRYFRKYGRLPSVDSPALSSIEGQD